MIEQSHRPLLPPQSEDLGSLERRANHQRFRHRQASQSRHSWQHPHSPFGSLVQSIVRLPTRFLLHAVVALLLPLAVVLGQVQTGTLLPTTKPTKPQRNDDFIVPVAPLDLNNQVAVGDPPLEDNGEIPVPLSLISRSEALAPVVVPSTIAGDRIILRNGPGTQYDAVGRMSGGASVQVFGRYGDWFQIRESVGKPTFWVSGELLKISDEDVSTLFEVQADAIPAPPPAKVGVVRESGLQLRDGPGTNYVSMTKLDAGSQLDLLESYQNWLHVGIRGGADGWVKSEFIDVDPNVLKRLLNAETIPDPNPAMTGVINDNQVSLRAGPDSKYSKVTMANTGTQFNLVGKYQDWFKVQIPNGAMAWVFSDLVNVPAHVVRRLPVTQDFPALPVPDAPQVNRTAPAQRGGSPVVSSGIVRSGGGGGGAASASLANMAASGDIASFAIRFAGSRYVYGGAGPGGFDCSGLVTYVYSRYGISLPHNAAAQYTGGYGARVGSSGNLKPGDIVFFANTAGERGITHAAIYLGNGRIIHAMTPSLGVQVSNINDAYWQNHYYGTIRVNR